MFTNFDAEVTFCRFGNDVPMHVRPPCVHRHVWHTPTPRMCGMNCSHVGVLYGIGDGNPIIDAYTAFLHVKILPRAVYIGADLTSTVLVICHHAISYLHENCIFGSQACHERAGEDSRKRKNVLKTFSYSLKIFDCWCN